MDNDAATYWDGAWGEDEEGRPKVLLSMGAAWEGEWTISGPLGKKEVGEGAAG